MDKITPSDFLSLNIPNNKQESSNPIIEKILNKLQLYYTTPPNEKIIPYLVLMFEDFGKLKLTFPLLMQPEYYYNSKINKDSFELEYIDQTFGWKSQKNYILNLAYQEDYKNFYTNEDKIELQNYIDKDDEKYDVICKVQILQMLSKKNSDFPYADLIYSMGLFDV